MNGTTDVVVVGGGQAALAVAYFLRRTRLRFVLLDEQEGPGGAWRQGWASLTLFSPAESSSLPGWPMRSGDGFPPRDAVLDYLARYERRYGFPVERPVAVERVERAGEVLQVVGDRGVWQARAVVSATGTWRNPHVPEVPGGSSFQGLQMHSAHYRTPQPFAGRRVLVVGGGNSGAQIQAEISKVADATWVTLRPPRFLPDEVDGRVLFRRATERWLARKDGRPAVPPDGGLGDIVMVPPVREARERGALATVRPFVHFDGHGVVWQNGRREAVDAVIWCTGFRPALEHLRPLGIVGEDGRVEVAGTRSVEEPRLWLVGYGEWTGFASATLIGVGRSARSTVEQIAAALGGSGGEPR